MTTNNNITSVYNSTAKTYITKEEILQKIDDVINILYDGLGYYDINKIQGISFNPRLKKALGRTYRKDGKYTIQFNVTFLEVASLDKIEEIIAHECIHLIPGCWDHKTKFKQVAHQLTKYGYDIHRTTCDENYQKIRMEAKREKIQYTPYCKKCGKKYKSYTNYTKVVRCIAEGMGGYYCNKCGSRNLGIKIQYPNGSIEEK